MYIVHCTKYIGKSHDSAKNNLLDFGFRGLIIIEGSGYRFREITKFAKPQNFPRSARI